MNADEFSIWVKHHVARFPSVSAWLGKYPVSEPRSSVEPTQTSILGAWRGILADIELNDAKRASDLLANGDEEFSLKSGFDSHPRDVRRLSKSFAGQRSKESRWIKRETISPEEVEANRRTVREALAVIGRPIPPGM